MLFEPTTFQGINAPVRAGQVWGYASGEKLIVKRVLDFQVICVMLETSPPTEVTLNRLMFARGDLQLLA
jgi:hypothetical protein